MAIEVRCPCGKCFQVEDEARGDAIACPECGREVAAPPRPPVRRTAEPLPIQETVLAICLHAERLWKQAWAKVAPLLAAAYDEVRQTARYYRHHRYALLQRFEEYVNRLPEYEREIRITADESRAGVSLEDGHWTVQLPDCCITCGAETRRDWQSESRQVADVTAAFWAPVAGLAAGLVLAPLLGSIWWIPVAFLLSFIPGHKLRREVAVDLEVRRCEAHAGHSNMPELYAFGKQLVIRCENQAVKQQSIRERRDWVAPAPAYSPEPVEELSSIPLDDCEAPKATQPSQRPGEDLPTLPLEDDDLTIVSTPVSFSGQDATDALELDEASRASQADGDVEQQPPLHDADVPADYVDAAFSSATATEDRIEAEKAQSDEFHPPAEKDDEYRLSDEPPAEPAPEDKG